MPTGMKTRRQAMADQAAGQPQSPLKELPATRTRNRKEKKNTTEANLQTTGASPVRSSKRTLDSDDTTIEPAPKRSRLYRAAPKVRKITGTLNKDTGLIEGGAYTLDGQLVLTPCRPDTVIEISDDEARWPFDEEKGRFNRNPLDLRKRPRRKFRDSTATQPSQAQTEKSVGSIGQNSDSNRKTAAAMSNASSTVTPEIQSGETVAVATGAEIQNQTKEQPVPVTPRQWGFTNLARSVSRFVPRLPFSGNRSRATPEDHVAVNASNTLLTMRGALTQSDHINTNGDIPNIQEQSNDNNTDGDIPSIQEQSNDINMHEDSQNIREQQESGAVNEDTSTTKTADENNSNIQQQSENEDINAENGNNESEPAQHHPHTGPRQFRNRSNPENTPATSYAERRQGRTLQSGWKSRAQKRTEKEERERKILLAENKRLIDEEVARQVTAAMREEENRRKAEGADVTGKKRKRYSPDIIPNPKGCSYGMDLDYFGDSSSDDEAEEEDTPTKPSKRARVSIREPSTPTRKPIGDLTRATPYTGITFADPRPNLFDNVNISPPVVYVPTPSITFEVPYDSDSVEEEESDDNVVGRPAQPHNGATTQTVLSTAADPGPPPPRPNPSHAALPSTGNISSDTDALARARSQALRYTPRQPSGLRASSRLSTSTVASDIGNEQQLENVPEFIADNQNEVASDIVPQQGTNEQLDLEVATALASIPDSGLIQFDFPKPQTYADVGIIDPEVQAYLNSTWTLEDEEQAGRIFEANFATWSGQQLMIPNSNLVT